MSTLAEIKSAVDTLSIEEMMELNAYMWSSRQIPVVYSETIDERMREMDAGKKVRWADIREEILEREKLPD
jgi:hypothetical protein